MLKSYKLFTFTKPQLDLKLPPNSPTSGNSWEPPIPTPTTGEIFSHGDLRIFFFCPCALLVKSTWEWSPHCSAASLCFLKRHNILRCRNSTVPYSGFRTLVSDWAMVCSKQKWRSCLSPTLWHPQPGVYLVRWDPLMERVASDSAFSSIRRTPNHPLHIPREPQVNLKPFSFS